MSEKQSKNTYRAPKTHRLKTWPEHFAAIRSQQKTFELRRNDRDFCAGDQLVLVEWDPKVESETGQTEIRNISHVFVGGRFGLAKTFCILSLKPMHGAKLPINNPSIYELTKYHKRHE